MTIADPALDAVAARVTGQAEPPSRNEALKVAGNGLAGPLFAEIADASTDHISADAAQILTFHGSYEQDDRDQRIARRKQGLDRAYSFMVRTKFPGGRLAAEQYLLADVLDQWRGARRAGEPFGEWAHRALAASATWTQPAVSAPAPALAAAGAA